jgi:serine/threonine protein kinase
MQDVIENIIENTKAYPVINQDVVDYSEILTFYGLNYIRTGYYCQVGEMGKVQGWIIDLSVIKIQIPAVLNAIIPLLVDQAIPLKVVRDSIVAEHQLNGQNGYYNVGKVISVYPPTDKIAVTLARLLIEVTASFRGPDIPTDCHLGNIVYTRFGAFNPIRALDINGRPVDCIYDSKGQLMADPLTIPFALPSEIAWPFSEITSPELPKRSKLLNYKYYPISTLKPDPRGKVVKALYFQHFWKIKSCLIKQGRRDMLADEVGRDIQERLKWQYEIHTSLAEILPLPRVLDLFQENNSSYLVMEFIHGISFTKWIYNTFRDRRWLDLPVKDRLQILDHLLIILSIIQRLHKKGFVHRDITPENFLIDKKKKIHLIDMELSWSSARDYPTPPFRLGTDGFMSPEQRDVQIPGEKEDIYAVGALMLVFITNLTPLKFSCDSDQLKKTVTFFTGEKELANCISDCLKPDPANRPELSDIIYSVKKTRSQIWKSDLLPGTYQTALPSRDIERIIQDGITGLSNKMLLNSDNCWVSNLQQNDPSSSVKQFVLTTYGGWHTGMAGPLWLLAKAKKAGYKIEACHRIYMHSWAYIQEHYFTNTGDVAPGLYNGSAGIAMTITEGLNAGLLSSEITVKYLEGCFSSVARNLSLSTGAAGQGLALLYSAHWLDKKFVDTLLNEYTTILLDNQQADGSWNMPSGSRKKKDIRMGLDDGIAGILWFLLACLETKQDEKIRNACIKGINWLTQKAHKKRGVYSWKKRTKGSSIDQWNTGNGNPGIILLFIKAYELLKNPTYKQIAEAALKAMPSRPVITDFGLNSGLSGVGELYLEAFRVFKDIIWQERAAWIAHLFFQTQRSVNKEYSIWTVNDSSISTADLSTGISGLLHFMIWFTSQKMSCHYLIPQVHSSKSNG